MTIKVTTDSLRPTVTVTDFSFPNDLKHTMTSWYFIDNYTGKEVHTLLYSNSDKVTYTATEDLNPSTEYKVRIVFYSEEKTTIIKEKVFTTPAVSIDIPEYELELTHDNNEVYLTLTKPFVIHNSNEEHIATTWIVKDTNENIILEKFKDKENLTKLNVTDYLNIDTIYYVSVRFHTDNYVSENSIKYIKVPIFTYGEPYDILHTVELDDDLLPTIRIKNNNNLNNIVKSVTLTIKKRNYPNKNITMSNRVIPELEGKRLDDVVDTLEFKLTKEDMLYVGKAELTNPLSTWVLPWVFNVNIVFVDGTRSYSRPVYRKIPLRYNAGKIRQINQPIPVFQLEGYSSNVTWDRPKKVTWIVYDNIGNIIVKEERSSIEHTFNLENYVYKQQILPGHFYFVQAAVTTEAGITVYTVTGNENNGRSDRVGELFYLPNTYLEDPYITLEKFNLVDENKLSIDFNLSNLRVKNNPFGIEYQHLKTAIRLLDITDHNEEKLVYEANITPVNRLVISRSKDIVSDFSIDNTNVGIYYDRRYRLEVAYITDTLTSKVSNYIFSTPPVPMARVSKPKLKESSFIRTGDIKLLSINLDPDVEIGYTSQQHTKTKFELYRGNTLVYKKITTEDKYLLSVFDITEGLLEPLQEDTEYWLDVTYYVGTTVSKNTFRYYLEPLEPKVYNKDLKPKVELRIVSATATTLLCKAIVMDLPEEIKNIYWYINDVEYKNGQTMEFTNLLPETTYEIVVNILNSKDEIMVTRSLETRTDIPMTDKDLVGLQDTWDIVVKEDFTTNIGYSKLPMDLLRYILKQDISHLIKYKRVSIYRESLDSYPYYEDTFTTPLDNYSYVLEFRKLSNLYATNRIFFKVELGLTEHLWLEPKIIEIPIQKFNKDLVKDLFRWYLEEETIVKENVLDGVDGSFMFKDKDFKDKVLRVYMQCPKYLMKYVDHIALYYHNTYGYYTIAFEHHNRRLAEHDYNDGMFLLVPTGDYVKYTRYRDTSGYIDRTPKNINKVIVFKDGSKLLY
jgi:hypothetical protein